MVFFWLICLKFSCLLFPELNYFQVKQLFEHLKLTDAGKKNLIGQFSNQSMKVGVIQTQF